MQVWLQHLIQIFHLTSQLKDLLKVLQQAKLNRVLYYLKIWFKVHISLLWIVVKQLLKKLIKIISNTDNNSSNNNNNNSRQSIHKDKEVINNIAHSNRWTICNKNCMFNLTVNRFQLLWWWNLILHNSNNSNNKYLLEINSSINLLKMYLLWMDLQEVESISHKIKLCSHISSIVVSNLISDKDFKDEWLI